MWIGFHPRAALPRQVPLRTRTARAPHTDHAPRRGAASAGPVRTFVAFFFDNNTSHRSATARAANRLESTLQRSVYTAQRRDEPMSAVNQHASQEIAIRSVNTYTYLRCRAPGSRLSARGGRAVLLAPRYEHHPWPCADLPPLGRVAPLHMHCRASVRRRSVLPCHGMHITSDKPISPPFPLCIYHVSSRTAASAAPALRGTSGKVTREDGALSTSPLSMRGEPTSRQTSRSASRHASIPSIIRSGNRTAMMALIAPYLRSVRAPRGHASS